jgi:hypothetical protein
MTAASARHRFEQVKLPAGEDRCGLAEPLQAVGLHQAPDVIAVCVAERARRARLLAGCHGRVDQVTRQRGQAG